MKWLTQLFGKIFNNRVSKDVCLEVQKTNDLVHGNLEDCIEGATRECTTRYLELKNDMQREFDEVKQLLRQL
ncbi:hypothetical protein LCGC14_0752840 [marine sediment metagenome]|uniref:Uncharacterized protein n=1 Tax=marine sediment metagenome TaxID=412755 RepID=A0A0F9Q3F3_9ZZZZ